MTHLQNYPDRRKIVFSPDLPTSNYSKAITDLLTSLNISLVESVKNLLNLPQFCPKDDVWSNLRLQVYKKG